MYLIQFVNLIVLLTGSNILTELQYILIMEKIQKQKYRKIPIDKQSQYATIQLCYI